MILGHKFKISCERQGKEVLKTTEVTLRIPEKLYFCK